MEVNFCERPHYPRLTERARAFICYTASMQPGAIRQFNASGRAWATNALINRNFALFVGGSFVTSMGSWFQTVAIGWLVLEISDSTFLLGVSNFALMAPMLVLGLVGGAMADRTDRRLLILITQAIVTFISGVLAFVTYVKLASIPVVLGLILIIGITSAFLWPAWPTFIKDLVGERHLRTAISTNSARYNLTRVLGPALAGVFLAEFGTAHSLTVAAVTGAAVLASLLAIRLPPGPKVSSLPWVPAMRQGLSYAWRDGEVRTVLLATAAVAMFGMSYQAFMPAYARDTLQVGAWGLGLMLMAVGVGAVSGAVFSGSAWACQHSRKTLAILALGTGCALLAFAYSPNIWWALATGAAVGFCSIGYLVTGNATVQLKTPDHLMGRVMGLWVVINSGTMPIGALALGALSEVAGLPLTLALAGGICAIAGLALLRLFRAG